MPTGTSSIKKDTNDSKWIIQAQEKGWPLSKKYRWANRECSLKECLQREPRIDARAATKNEPGLKRRALRAMDDHSFLV